MRSARRKMSWAVPHLSAGPVGIPPKPPRLPRANPPPPPDHRAGPSMGLLDKYRSKRNPPSARTVIPRGEQDHNVVDHDTCRSTARSQDLPACCAHTLRRTLIGTTEPQVTSAKIVSADHAVGGMRVCRDKR